MKFTTFMEKTDKFMNKLKTVIMYGNTKVSYFMIGAMNIITTDYCIRGDWFNTGLGVVIVSIFYFTERDANVKEAQ